MESIKNFVLFFVRWISVVIALFTVAIIVRLFVKNFDIIAAINLPAEFAGTIGVVGTLIGFMYACYNTPGMRKFFD